jgi:hypothetical protein
LHCKTQTFVRYTALAVFIALFSFSSYARYGVKVQARTQSSRTLILNIGTLNQIKEGDKAVLVYSDIFGSELVNTDIVARAIAVKVDDSESIWYVNKIYNLDALRSEKRFILMAPGMVLNGRKRYRVKRTAIIKTKDQDLEEVAREFEMGIDKQELAKKEKDYYEQLDLRDQEGFSDSDFNLADVYEWEKLEAESKKVFPKSIYKSEYKSEFEKRQKLETFEKVLLNYLAKANKKYFIPGELHQNILNEKAAKNFDDSRSEMLEEKYRQRQKMKKKYEEIAMAGPRWSEDLSDDDLARVMDEYAIAKEMKRRESVYMKKFNYQLFIGYGMNLRDNENATDAFDGQDSKTDFTVGLEFHLLNKYEGFERFTVEWALRRAYDGVGIDNGEDAVTSETSGAISIDWHPFAPPGLVERNTFFLGTTIRLGRTRLKDPDTDAQALYNMNSFLGLRSGVKYSFSNGVGIRLMASIEKLSLDKTEANNVGNNLPAVLDYDDFKLSAAFSYFF